MTSESLQEARGDSWGSEAGGTASEQLRGEPQWVELLRERVPPAQVGELCAATGGTAVAGGWDTLALWAASQEG